MGGEGSRAGDAAAPWELIEEVFILGSPEQMRERLDEFVAGGVTCPVLLPITAPTGRRPDRGARPGLSRMTELRRRGKPIGSAAESA